MTVAAASGTTALWFVTRATGNTAMVLLTVTVALGVANVRRLHTRRTPRFVVDAVHRNVGLLAVTFLFAHIVTSVVDGYVPIRWIDAVVPFDGSYRPFWLGLGAVALDLLIAVTLTSLVRRRLGHRAWRATHWLAYACWPVALGHGLGIGSDAGTGWMLAVMLACVLVVLAAALTRLVDRRSGSAPGRGGTATGPGRFRPAAPGVRFSASSRAITRAECSSSVSGRAGGR
jgi:DMSO/TMAO reductase YedYZ heme-binding membrane subunit